MKGPLQIRVRMLFFSKKSQEYNKSDKCGKRVKNSQTNCNDVAFVVVVRCALIPRPSRYLGGLGLGRCTFTSDHKRSRSPAVIPADAKAQKLTKQHRTRKTLQ